MNKRAGNTNNKRRKPLTPIAKAKRSDKIKLAAVMQRLG